MSVCSNLIVKQYFVVCVMLRFHCPFSLTGRDIQGLFLIATTFAARGRDRAKPFRLHFDVSPEARLISC